MARVRPAEGCEDVRRAEDELDREPPASGRRPLGRDALARAALEHIDSLHHFAYYLSGNGCEAEELVQETYARALGASSSFASGTNLRAWLFRILRNLFIDGRRRSRESLSSSDGAEPASDQAAFAREPLFGDVEMEGFRSEVVGDIERSLAALTPDGRAVVLLDLEGFSESEIAEVLGCAAGTVKSRLARARESLRNRLREYRR